MATEGEARFVEYNEGKPLFASVRLSVALASAVAVWDALKFEPPQALLNHLRRIACSGGSRVPGKVTTVDELKLPQG